MRMGRVRMRMGRVRMKMNMRMMTLYLPEISSQGGGEGEGGFNWKVSGFPIVLVPAYSVLREEQLQLAQLVFAKSRVAKMETTCACTRSQHVRCHCMTA